MTTQTEPTVYCPQCGEAHYWGEHTRRPVSTATFHMADGTTVTRQVKRPSAHTTRVAANGDGTYSGTCRDCQTSGPARPTRAQAQDDAWDHLFTA